MSFEPAPPFPYVILVKVRDRGWVCGPAYATPEGAEGRASGYRQNTQYEKVEVVETPHPHSEVARRNRRDRRVPR